MHQHATFFLFLIFICFLLANQSLRIFGHKLKAVTSPCLFVQAVTSNFAFSGGGVGEAIREELFKAGSCGSWDWDSGLGRLEMSIFHLGNRSTMCPLIGSCQRLAWWFVMVVLGQPFVPLEQVPLRLKFIHLALSSKRVEFSFNWHTQIWELSSYPRCTPRGHTRYPETMIINHNYINYILSSKQIGVWSSVESLFRVILIPIDFHEVCQWWYVPWSHPSLLTKCCMLNGWNGSILDLGFNPWSPV